MKQFMFPDNFSSLAWDFPLKTPFKDHCVIYLSSIVIIFFNSPTCYLVMVLGQTLLQHHV